MCVRCLRCVGFCAVCALSGVLRVFRVRVFCVFCVLCVFQEVGACRCACVVCIVWVCVRCVRCLVCCVCFVCVCVVCFVCCGCLCVVSTQSDTASIVSSRRVDKMQPPAHRNATTRSRCTVCHVCGYAGYGQSMPIPTLWIVWVLCVRWVLCVCSLNGLIPNLIPLCSVICRHTGEYGQRRQHNAVCLRQCQRCTEAAHHPRQRVLSIRCLHYR